MLWKNLAQSIAKKCVINTRPEEKKWLKNMSRSFIKIWAPREASKQLIGRAANLLYLELKNIVS